MESLARNWWLLVLRGGAAIVFGVLTLVWPGSSLASLVLLFGVYSIIEGATSLRLAFMRAEGRTGTWILHAIVGIGAGVLTFIYPTMTAVALYWVIAIWAIATGIVEIVMASQLRDLVGSVGPVVFAGIASILLGVALVVFPAAGMLALLGVIAGFAILSGIAWVSFGMRVHRHA